MINVIWNGMHLKCSWKCWEDLLRLYLILIINLILLYNNVCSKTRLVARLKKKMKCFSTLSLFWDYHPLSAMELLAIARWCHIKQCKKERKQTLFLLFQLQDAIVTRHVSFSFQGISLAPQQTDSSSHSNHLAHCIQHTTISLQQYIIGMYISIWYKKISQFIKQDNNATNRIPATGF